jgi:hypothetical protein
VTGAQPRNTNVQIANQVQPLARQTVARNSDAAAAPTALGTKAAKKKDKVPEKVNFFRCDVVGHFSIDCTAELCVFYESVEHANKDFPLHSAP